MTVKDTVKINCFTWSRMIIGLRRKDRLQNIKELAFIVEKY